ncbi:hypothetical protein CL620_06150 [archaeon]|jgi:hypothetical protein|nr:hypothetical protein [archaeon]
MGLDNIPKNYPCRVEHGIDENEVIDCKLLISEGKCPWKKDLGKDGYALYGMLGTYCWYRGKSGNFMLDEMTDAGYDLPSDANGDPLSFYGDNGNGAFFSPEGQVRLAEWMLDHKDTYAKICNTDNDTIEDCVGYWKYAANWLLFTSKYGGSVAWC